MRKWLFVLVIIIVALIGYNYMYQEHRNIQSEDAMFTTSSNQLTEEFFNNSSEAELKYLNKTIEVSGEISEVNKKDLTLNKSVFCQFNVIINSEAKLGDTVKIKGRVIGFDDLLEQVKLDQCTIIDIN